MKKIWIQLFIVIIGILLCIASIRGISKYVDNKFNKRIDYYIVYNDYTKKSYTPNIIIEEKESETDAELVEEKNIETTTKVITTTKIKTTTTTTTTTATTATTTTTSSTQTTLSTEKNNTLDDSSELTIPTIEDNGEIIYDGLTLEELTNKLNKNLNSTLKNTGIYFSEYYKRTGLDPYLSVAIVLQETGCKWTCSKLVRECNNIGGIKGKPSCNGGSYKKYDTLEEGINGYLNTLYNNYYSKGLTTPELINPKYATSTTWSTKINNYIDSIRAS